MISYSKIGEGPAIVLIHGFCETKEMWKTFSKDLSTSFTVYAIDLPGFGESTLNQTEITLEEIASEIEGWIRLQGINQPFVIGHSLGGYVLLALAESLGSKLKGIGLFHSTALPDSPEKQKTRNNVISFVERNGVDKFIDSFVPGLFADENLERNRIEIEELIISGKRTSLSTFIAYTKAMRDRQDRMELWKTFPGKKLFIAGLYDMAVPIENSRMHKSFSDVYEELTASAHMGMFEEPIKSMAAVRKFLSL